MPAQAGAGFTSDFVITSGRVKGTVIGPNKYYTNSNSADPSVTKAFQSQFLGTFDRSAGAVDSLFINAEANTLADNTDNVGSTQLLYRVFRLDRTDEPGNSIPLPLGIVAGTSDGTAKWTSLKNRSNLVDFAATPGTYVLEVYFQGNATVSKKAQTILDDNGGSPYYTATFEVTIGGSSVITENWSPRNGSTNWSDGNNWTPSSQQISGYNNVPNSNTDVVIPYQAGSTYPIISSGTAVAHNILISGRNSNVLGARLRLSGGQLVIYGNFQDANGGFLQTGATAAQPTGGRLILAGTNQIFDAAPNLYNLTIQGGGTKTLTKGIALFGALTFGSGGGILVTRMDNPGQYSVTFPTNKVGGIVNESETGYVLGVVRATEEVENGITAVFGNIGVELTANNVNQFTAIAPGVTQATRTSTIYNGLGTSVSVRRGFFFQAESEPEDFNLVFHYLNADLNGINASNLRLYRTATGDYPFEPLFKDSSDPGAKTLTKSGITGLLSATFTLGDATNPLPVTITSFTAAAQGADAVLNWTTASETNNQGFEVQVSTDGTNFSKLGFLASNTPNSSTPHAYQYRDVTLGKQGVRYYRLRQLDLDGMASFVGPRAVTFGGSVAQTSLQGYPSPFNSEINLALQTTAAGLATVTVTDGVGRQVRAWQPTLAAGASSLRLADLQNMPAGLYIVQVRYNDGQTQRLKMVKE